MNNDSIQNNTRAIPGLKRIVILGHSGFIGSHLEKALESLYADTDVIGKSLPAIDLTNEKDTEELSDLLNPETAVIMCAAIKRQFGDTLEAYEQNLNMTINLCRLLNKRPVKQVIYFSSTAVYGEDVHNTRITEETPVCPTSYYGMAKFSSECLYRKAVGGKNPGTLSIIRPPLIYGPGDSGNTYGPAGFIKTALAREPITLWGDGMELREFIFVEDIVRVICGLLNSSFDGVVNVASGKSLTFMEILNIVSEIMDEELEIISKLRTKNKADHAFDNSHFMRLMPGFEFTTLEEGIRKTLEAESRLMGQASTGIR